MYCVVVRSSHSRSYTDVWTRVVAVWVFNPAPGSIPEPGTVDVAGVKDLFLLLGHVELNPQFPVVTN